MKKYDIIISSGKTKAILYSDLTHRNAVELCEESGWEIQFDGEGSFVWDMEIVESGKCHSDFDIDKLTR